MFEDVAQMEKEIETFRRNVVASSELVEGISRLTETAKQQMESFSASADDIIKKLDSCINEIKADHLSALQTLSDNNSAAITGLQEKASADLQAKLSEIEKIRSSIESCRTETVKKADEQLRQLSEESERLITELTHELSAQQDAYSEKLQRTEQTINGYQTDAEIKYNEFIRRLETTNVDQMFKEVQDLKQSFKTRFLIIMGGIGITLVAALLGIILK